MTENSEDQIVDPLEIAISTPANLGPLDRKIVECFPGLVVRKDLTKGLKQNAIVPTYVLEYLLGQHCATDDPDALRAGLEAVQRILKKHYVHRSQAELVKSTIKERGHHKVIDKVAAELNDKGGFYEAKFSNLGLKNVPIADDLVRRHPKLLVGGIWCITELTYDLSEDAKASPWHIDSLKPIQVSHADYEEFIATRRSFSTEEWMGVLLQTMGFNPEALDRRGKLLQLIRLVPFCERNYNLMELGPKGTGKSHIFAEFSPHGILISGAEVSVAKLFVNNASGKIGLVGYWDCICFDEFAGKDKKVDKNLVDIMKNFMANKSFSRGIEQLTAEASMVFMGNTTKTMEYMLKHSHFFEPLPDKYIDSAFLDRLHAYSPGWEVPPVRNELFTSGYGFIVDYLAEILKHQRTEDFTGAYKERFEIVSELSTRDQTGFEKTFSGLMKLLYPNGEATDEEMEELVAFSMECRRRVREHILRIDDTFVRHDFVFRRVDGGLDVTVLTPEEKEFPTYAAPRLRTIAGPGESGAETEQDAPEAEPNAVAANDVIRDEIDSQDAELGVESRATIPELIAMGEGKRVEFKSSARWSYKKGDRDEVCEQALVRTVAGFLNTKGGTLLVGVRDDGEPIGLDKDYKLTKGTRDGFENWLTDLLEGAFGKPPLAGLSVSFQAMDGNDVCRIDVEASSSPVFVKRGDDRYLFARFNNSTRLLNAEDVLRYVRDHFGS